jgi:hypothetical protein
MTAAKTYDAIYDCLRGTVKDPGDVLSIMRLFPGSYTQTDHSKVRKSFKM